MSNKDFTNTLNQNQDDNIIVHLPHIYLKDLYSVLPKDQVDTNPLDYNPNVNIPKESNTFDGYSWLNNPDKSLSKSASVNENNNIIQNEDNNENNLNDENIYGQKQLDNIGPHNYEIQHENWKKAADEGLLNLNNIDISDINRDQINMKQKLGKYIKSKNKNVNCKKEYQYANKTLLWPNNVSEFCNWDFHSFDNMPIAIPIKYENGIFHLVKNFCSCECAAAYIDGHYDEDDANEYYSLLHLIYRRKDKIEPAPSRDTLIEFGGNFTIERFRQAAFDKSITSEIKMPPFLSCIPIQEEINMNVNFISSQNGMFIPINKTQINKAVKNVNKQKQQSFLQSDNNIKNYLNYS